MNFSKKTILKIIFLGALVTAPFYFLSAQTATDIRNRIEQADEEIRRLEREIAQYQKEVESLSQQKDSLQVSLKELDLNRKKLKADIAVTENKISKTNLKIQNLSMDIGDKESSIQNNERSIGLGIKNMNELESKNLLEILLSEDDISTMWNDLDSLVSVRENLRENIASLKETKVVLEDTRAETIAAKNELTRLKSQLADQEKIVIQNTNEKNKLLQQTKNSETAYQALLRDRIAKRDAFEKEIEAYEAQLKYILDPNSLPSGRVLSWPLDNIYITQFFGRTTASGRLYASGTHNGVDMRAAIGTPVKAMADGVVKGVGDTDQTCPGASFGKFVFIEHDNNLSSAFGHLSLVTVREGQQVKRGQVVAYSGNTGHSTGPHLHISLYAPGAAKMTSKPSVACEGRTYRLPAAAMNGYLDVLKYLPQYAASQVKPGAGGL